MTIPFLSDTSKIHPDKPAIFTSQKIISYAELEQMVAAVSAKLLANGIGEHVRVGLVSQNSTEMVVFLMALLRVKAIAAPINIRFVESEICARLTEIDVDVAFFSESFFSIKFDRKSAFSLDAFVGLAGQKAKMHVAEKLKLEQKATVIFTSGSSAKPKAALHSFGAHYFNAKGSNENICLTPGAVWLLSLPLFHVGGYAILIRTVLAGAAIAMPSPSDTLETTLEKFPVTHLSLVATQLYRLMQNAQTSARLKRLSALLLGGSAMPSSLIGKCKKEKISVFTSYGCTEMASQVTTTANASQLNTSGKLLSYRELKISDEGEILLKGKTLFNGYLDGKTCHKPFDAQGWYHTKDLGKIDENGCLTVLGRKDNMFISGGENIQPEEIEAALCLHPDVVQAVVLPYNHAEYGQRPAAFLQLKTNEKPNSVQLREFLSKKLARYKVPDIFFELPEKIVNNGLKVNRAECKVLLKDLQGQLK